MYLVASQLEGGNRARSRKAFELHLSSFVLHARKLAKPSRSWQAPPFDGLSAVPQVPIGSNDDPGLCWKSPFLFVRTVRVHMVGVDKDRPGAQTRSTATKSTAKKTSIDRLVGFEDNYLRRELRLGVDDLRAGELVIGQPGAYLLAFSRDRRRRRVWVVLRNGPDMPAAFTAIVIDEGVPTAVFKETWRRLSAGRARADRHGVAFLNVAGEKFSLDDPR